MFFLVVSILLPFAAFPLSNMEPIRMESCARNKWLARHFIVYSCNFSDLADPDLAKREIKPIACDPTNGVNVKMNKKPLFPGFEHKGDDGFIYECEYNEHQALVYKAKACYIQDERFLPGHFVMGAFNVMYFCYRELDGLLRIRIRRPVHSACNPLVNDLRCQQGIAQTIMNSQYGYGESFAYNPVNGETLTVATPPPPNAVEVSLQEDRAAVSPQEILHAIRGAIVPSFRKKATTGEVNLRLSDLVKRV